MTRQTWSRFFLIAASILVSACGGADITGEWRGTWRAGGVVGEAVVSLEQTGEEVEGSAVFSGSPCMASPLLRLVIVDDRVSGTASAGDNTVSISGVLRDDVFSGSFESSAVGCRGRGDFTLHRSE